MTPATSADTVSPPAGRHTREDARPTDTPANGPLSSNPFPHQSPTGKTP